MSQKDPIGVMGCLPRLPNEFPVSYPENSGNMVHASVPFKIFNAAFFAKDYNYNSLGYANFIDFVNKKCSHLIVTLANTLRLGDTDGTKYARLLDFLVKIEKPIIVFGLGVQSKHMNLDEAALPIEAINLVKYLSGKAEFLGVRGEFTKKVVSKLCEVKNAYVTGCPSIYSNPEAFGLLRENIKSCVGMPSFSGTRYFEDRENALFFNAIKSDHWLVEPVNKFNHAYYLKVASNEDSYEDVPYFLKRRVKGEYDRSHYLRQFFLSRYRIFRNTDDWYQFNADVVSYTYGTRFHVNMASLVSGKPALWLTHDARTRELVEFMNLPHVDVHSGELNETDSIGNLISYEKFFDGLTGLYRNFNRYLQANGLPEIKSSF